MRFVLKGVRNLGIGAFQLVLPMPTWFRVTLAMICFGTALGYFYQGAAQEGKGQ